MRGGALKPWRTNPAQRRRKAELKKAETRRGEKRGHFKINLRAVGGALLAREKK